MALTLNFEGANDGRFDCTKKIIRCFACGGKPPYRWQVTVGQLDRTDGMVVKLSPPVNVNPGSSPGVAAFKWAAKYCSALGFNDCVCQMFDCAGNALNACEGIGCSDALPVGCGCAGGTDSCTLYSDGATSPGCAGLPVFNPPCSGLPALHYTKDLRTQNMKDNGCKPCSAEMNGAVVTVTDSLGNSVARSLTA
jgi:hypothetical protein